MSTKHARALHSGDEVTWNDPDNGLCTQTFIIGSIEHLGNGVFRIGKRDGGTLEVLASELS